MKILGRTAFTIILGAILISSTFSPQFLIWVAPFVAFLTVPEILMFIGASSLTWIYFRYWDDIALKLMPLATEVLVARNLLLVLLFVVSLSILVYEIVGIIKQSRLKQK